MNSQTLLIQNFNITKQFIYDECEFVTTAPHADAESAEYGAGTYKVNDLQIICRTAKITPKKLGQFVAIWQRDQNHITQPQHIDNDFDLLVINCQTQDKFGQFVFPKAALAKHGIITTATKRGKNGIRIYPSWDTTTNRQAIKTQKWQLQYFLEVDERPNLELAKTLYLSK